MLNMSVSDYTPSAILICPSLQLSPSITRLGILFSSLILSPSFFFFSYFIPHFKKKVTYTHIHTHMYTHFSDIVTNTLILKFLISPHFSPLPHFPSSVNGTFIYLIPQAKTWESYLTPVLPHTHHSVCLQVLLILPPKCISNLFIPLYFYF